MTYVEEMKKLQETPAFTSAKETLSQKRYSAAADQFGALLEKMVDEHGDLSPVLAPLYYAYGDSLLLQVESNSNVFGESVKKSKSSSSSDEIEEKPQDESNEAVEAIEEEEEEEEEDQAEGEGEEGESAVDMILMQLIEEYKKNNGEDPTDEVLNQWKEAMAGANLASLIGGDQGNQQESGVEVDGDEDQQQKEGQSEEQPEENDKEPEEGNAGEEGLSAEEMEEIMNIAWEILETGRVVASRALEESKDEEEIKYLRKLLGDMYLRLADSSMERGHYEQSVQDYMNCVEKYQQVFSPDAMDMADVFSHLATSYIFAASAVQDVFVMRSLHFKALGAYLQAIHALVANRNKILGLDTTVHPPALDVEMEEESIEEASDSKAKVAVKKETKVEAEEVPLSKAEEAMLEQIKKELKRITQGVPTEDELKENKASDKETEESKMRVVMIEELRLKIDDIILVFENKEASQALLGGGSEAVEKSLNDAKEATSAFDKPSTESSSSGPTNLLQVRKKADPANDQANLVAVKRKSTQPEQEQATKKVKPE